MAKQSCTRHKERVSWPVARVIFLPLSRLQFHRLARSPGQMGLKAPCEPMSHQGERKDIEALCLSLNEAASAHDRAWLQDEASWLPSHAHEHAHRHDGHGRSDTLCKNCHWLTEVLAHASLVCMHPGRVSFLTPAHEEACVTSQQKRDLNH